MTFILHPNFNNKIPIIELPLCKVLLENNKYYPWLILIPKKSGMKKWIDLSFLDQIQLLKELQVVQLTINHLYSPDQINVAALGNVTPQLHIHVVARFSSDLAWPDTVWNRAEKIPYSESEILDLIQKIRINIENHKDILA